MKDRIRTAFEDIRADEALLANTAAYINEKRISRKTKKRSFRPQRLVSALAAMLILVAGVFGLRAFYADPVSYVSIDVNPSVELRLNRSDKVISAVSYNGDGEDLLRQINVTGMPYEEAVERLLLEMESQGYFSEDALITMTVQTKDAAKEQALCDALLQSVTGQMEVTQSTAEIEVFPVTQQLRERAHECHMSAAKYLVIQELLEVDETATLEEFSDATIRQIRQRTQACREEHQNSGEISGNGNYGGGQGQGGNGHHGNQGHGNGQRRGNDGG